jgi:uncharacterized iron-regulated membrane protein
MAKDRRTAGDDSSRRSFKRILQTVHLWMGLVMALPIILIGISGSGLLLQREILAYQVPAATADGERAPLAQIIAAAQTAAPENATARSIVMPAYAASPVTINFDSGGRPPRSLVHMDPVSLEILGSENNLTNRGPVLDVLISAHAFLLLPAWIGFPIVGWLAVAMTFMAVSGIILWWPRKGTWRHAFWVRKGAHGLRFHVELHHVLGFWGSVVLLIMGVSGIYLVFPDTFRRSVDAVLPTGQTSAIDKQYESGPAPLHADGALAAALAAMPGTRPIQIQMPPNPDLPFVVHLEPAGFRPKLPPILVTLNARTGEVNFIDDPTSYSFGDKFLNLQHALHFGIGLGWIWKALVFISGILPLALAITGVVMWLKRRSVKRLVPEAPEAVFSPAAE